MATDTKNESAPQEVSPSPTTGDGGSRQLNFSYKQEFKRLAKQAVLLLIFLLVLIGLGVLLRNVSHIGQKVYAQAAGHKIYKQDVKKLIGDNKNVSDHDAAKILADKYLTEAMAKQYGITVTDEDVQNAYKGIDIKQLKTKNPYGYQNLVNETYFAKLSASNEGVYKGKLLVAHFSRYVAYQSPLLAERKAQNPNLGNQAAIAADKKYAQDFITNLYNQIKAGKITFDQAIQMEHNDPVVGEKAYPSLSHSSTFDGPLSQIDLLNAYTIYQKVNAIKPGQTTGPFVVRVSSSMYDGSTAESYFLVVRLDSRSGGDGSMDFQQALAQAKQKLGYKVYV